MMSKLVKKQARDVNVSTSTMDVDVAVVQRVEELLAETKLLERKKELVREIARGEAGEEIELEDCDLGQAGAKAVAEALKNSPHVTRLRLWSNNLGPEGARAVAEGLEHVGNLQSLNLHRNNIGPNGARAIAEGLKHVPNLRELHLGYNSIGLEGARALAAGLQHVRHLHELYLSSNALGPDGGRAIAEGLKHIGNLQQLSLANNDLGPNGARAIAEALQYVENLLGLYLWENELGPDGARTVVEGLKHVPNLQTLNLKLDGLGAEGGQAVAEELEHLPNLQTLSLEYNNIGPTGARAVAEGLRHLDDMQELLLWGNDIGTEGAQAIGAVLPQDREIVTYFDAEEEYKAYNVARPTTSTMPHAEQDYGSVEAASLMSGEPPKQEARDHVYAFVATNGEERDDADKQAAVLKQLRQQLASKDRESKHHRQELQSEKAKVKSLEKTRQEQADQLKQNEQELASLKAANRQLNRTTVEQLEENGIDLSIFTQQLQETDNFVVALTISKAKLEDRVEELQQRLKAWQDYAETALKLNIPQPRFSAVKKARDHKGKAIKGENSILYNATLGGHRVALKQIENVHARPRLAEILHSSESTHGQQTRCRHREALILLSIRHPNIVSFLGLSHDKKHNTLTFVLSWAEGGSLYDHLHVHERELTKTQRARIAMEVAGAMQFLQAHDVVHRNLKSPNVLLDDSLSAKVTDFGLSAFKRGDDKTLTHQKGTPLWASPEQLLGLKLYADTDVFSFGVLYWELCFSCKPWHHGTYKGKGASVAAIAKAYENQKYLPVGEEINEVVLSAANQQLLGGCFDVSGNRLDFTQLHTALRELYNAAAHHQQLDEKQQTEMLFGAKDAVWKFPPSLLKAVKAVTKQLASRPSVFIAPLSLKRDVDAVKKLLTEAGGPTAAQPNFLKPFNHTLAAVAITHDKQKEAAFNGALARSKTRFRGHLTSGSSHPFSPKYKHNTSTKEPTDEEEKQVLRRVTCGTAYRLLDRSLFKQDPPLRLQRVFHGVTSWSGVVGMLGGDFASLQQLDGGLYGAGFYFTPDLDYALACARPCTDTVPPEISALGVQPGITYQVVLACDVQYGNPYPVLDAHSFNGKPLESGHDAHVAVVDFTSGGVVGAKPFPSHTEWAKGGKKPVAEIAVNDPSCVLVRAVLVFVA